jgi:hypothetical protein
VDRQKLNRISQVRPTSIIFPKYFINMLFKLVGYSVVKSRATWLLLRLQIQPSIYLD